MVSRYTAAELRREAVALARMARGRLVAWGVTVGQFSSHAQVWAEIDVKTARHARGGNVLPDYIPVSPDGVVEMTCAI